MKIGLLTYNFSANYGAVLQCYATCRILRELGHDVEIINVEQIKYSILHNLVFFPKDIAFERFREKYYAPRTRLFNSSEELRNEKLDYDVVVVGSDQVWNPAISNKLWKSFFLDFVKPPIKKISYASSFGIQRWPKEYEQYVNEVSVELKSFYALSVREATGQKILKDTFNVDSTLVVDPTILLNDYKEVVGDVQENGKIYCYLLNRGVKQLEKAKKIAKLYGEKPRMISTIYPYKGFKYVYPPSMESWLKYIAGAKLVITDSFHGVVFSLLNRRNFIVITPDNGMNSRIKDLLELVGINNKFFYENQDISYEEVLNDVIDYDHVHKVLAEERKKSLDFLTDAFRTINIR